MYPHVLSPLQVGQLQLRNRIVRAAHGVLLPWSDDGGGHIAYHIARAKGEVAMSIMGIGGVHPSNPTAIPTHEDRVVPGLQAVADAAHEHGMKLLCQIWHGGAVKPNMLGGAPWSASEVVNTARGVVPVAMTKGMIDEMVASFAAAARRVKAGGLDGVEIHGANGYLVNQFLSPATNLRSDEYGGRFENRLRFLAEVLDAVRAEVGPDFTMGLRLTSHEFVEGGLVPELTAQIATAVEAKVDYINVSLGGYWKPEEITGPTDRALGYQMDYSSIVTKAVSVPTMVTGRFMSLDTAEHVIESGAADMVSMVRGLIADPEIVSKTAAGKAAQVRPCIGILECVSSTLSGSFSCAVNPAAGHERELPPHETVKAEVARRVLVVGGGPAGMEAARSAALRGHQVSLYELRRRLGGQVQIAARAPYRSDYAAITAWQEDELRRLGVRIVLNTGVDPDIVAELAPDVLVIATGSEPRTDGTQLMRPVTPIDGAHLPNVYTSWDLFGAGRRAEPGGHAVVFDDTGLYEGLAVADELVSRGIEVTFVTPLDGLAERIAVRSTVVAPTLQRLGEANVRVMPRHVVTAVSPRSVEVRCGETTRELEADSLFLVGYNVPNRDLLEYLGDFPGEVHLVGDAAGFHSLSQAIHDGDAVGRRI
jgi:2,4-dienoyl-CoA reductase-like NADH-dependent reductase (Old Yellow Enzyme family)